MHFIFIYADAFGVLTARTAVQAYIQTFINIRGKARTVESRRAFAATTIGASKILLSLSNNLFSRNREKSFGFTHGNFDLPWCRWRCRLGRC